MQYPAFVFLALSYAMSISLPAATEHTARPVAYSQANRNLKLSPSTILADLEKRITDRPADPPKQWARYANARLKRVGFNYDFDLCEIVRASSKTQVNPSTSASAQMLLYQATLASGENLTLQLFGEEQEGGMCGECFFHVPALRVTRSYILAINDGKQYRLKRPGRFDLDEAVLVDETMRRGLRRWQLPYQTVPQGISADGKKLYLALYEGSSLDALLLELSEDGSVQFKARSDVGLGREGEWIEKHPKERRNAYLSFMRFRTRGGNYIIKFSAPCT